ncbi:uncharacterized protein Bfra_001980 [Botrytis fragariae]|uniref:Uncharacterized protein n=1 Tax=Botrytis fragariae TaxID=1964551 RepID=A0A8H6B1B0_9HELO|nr:uncharacterized protein Bfra_001980 [Botrytis fragariae]KAF5877613.1 hypothetical protein Bfra_001980 [Botrytis fragariae]
MVVYVICHLKMDLYFLLFFICMGSDAAHIITPRTIISTGSPTVLSLQARQTTAFATSTCGFLNGNANQPLVANSGSECTFDSTATLWGLCRTGLTLTDCGFGGYCIDAGPCSTGCGLTGTDVNTLSCAKQKSASFCVSSLLLVGADQTYTHMTCASRANASPPVFLLEATTTAPIPASTSEQSSSAATTVSQSNVQSNQESATPSASGSATNTASKASASDSGSNSISKSVPNSVSSGVIVSRSSDATSSSEPSPRESIFTVSGSLVTSFFGQTNTVGVTVSITTTASGVSSPSPSDSTAPAPENPPKYDPKALIGIVLGVIVFLLLLIFTLIWIGKYRRAQKSKSTTPTAESPTNFFFSNLPEVMEPFAKTDGIHEMYDDHEELRELDIAGAVAGRTGRVSVRELAATPVVGWRRSGRRSAREMEGDMVWGRERISIKELDGGVFVRNGRRGDSMTQVFELDGQSYI